VFDAITLDLLLPDMSGLEVLAGIRAAGANARAPIIVVTVVAARGVVAGFAVHDIMGKPLDGQALLASLRRAGVPSPHGTVLVVDDDPDALKLMSAVLAQLGYNAVCAENGLRGLELAKEVRPAAVILDLIMPGMDGFEFLDRFRTDPEGVASPVIIWTGKHLTGAEQSRLRASANAVVGKGHATSAAFVEDLGALLRPSAHS
jgi:CheY-like chemotaxis protein